MQLGAALPDVLTNGRMRMITDLLLGALVGILLSMPPGPIGVAVMKSALDGDERRGINIGLGTAVVDMVYALVSFFAASAAISAIRLYVSTHPLTFVFFQVAVIAIFLGYGLLQFRSKPKPADGGSERRGEGAFYRFLESLKRRNAFLIGVAMALANLANPTFIPSMTGVMMFLQEKSLLDGSSYTAQFTFSFGFGLGVFLWSYILLRFFAFYRHRMNQHFVSKLQRFAGLTFIGFGTVLGFRVLTATKWSEIFRFVLAF